MKSLSQVSKSIIVAGFAAVAMASSAQIAQAENAWIDEARFGGAWQNPDFLDKNHPEDDGVAILGEIFFAPFSDTDARDMPFLDALLAPRLAIGTNVATNSDYTSSIYGAVQWQFGVTEHIFIEASFGMAANNGDTNGNAADTRAKYGSNVLFRETLGLGVKLSDQWNAIVEVEHQSHASLFGDTNRGMTHLNVKFGYKF